MKWTLGTRDILSDKFKEMKWNYETWMTLEEWQTYWREGIKRTNQEISMWSTIPSVIGIPITRELYTDQS